jgi:large subunit ribosomal protein L32
LNPRAEPPRYAPARFGNQSVRPVSACRLQENFMAVQQNKKSPSKRGMHRSHNAVAAPGTAVEPTTGEVHLRHHISPTGFYRGRKVLKTKADA